MPSPREDSESSAPALAARRNASRRESPTRSSGSWEERFLFFMGSSSGGGCCSLKMVRTKLLCRETAINFNIQKNSPDSTAFLRRSDDFHPQFSLLPSVPRRAIRQSPPPRCPQTRQRRQGALKTSAT